MKEKIIDIAIIGGGSSGLMCGCIAGTLSREQLSIAIFEQNEKTGRKLLATGNGRCNLTNKNVSANSYFSEHTDIIADQAKYLDFSFTEKLFNDLGLLIKTDSSGWAYPNSNAASSVLDILRNSIKNSGVLELTGVKILSVKKHGDIFIINSNKTSYKARCVVLACGGCAHPALGSDGSGFDLAKKLGHRIEKVFPSLAPIVIEENLKALKGIRCKCLIRLEISGQILAQEQGELQINENDVSGICAMNLSHYINKAYAYGQKPPDIIIDFLPEISYDKAKTFILKNAYSNPTTPLKELLSGIINKRLGSYIAKNYTSLSPSAPCKNFSKKELIKICDKLKSFKLTPKEKSDFKRAQVSGGGVDLCEINIKNMASKKVDGLYFAGEIVDINAPCGGYNLHWAWASGSIAAKSAVLRCFNDKNQ